jgi:hypothetical protein
MFVNKIQLNTTFVVALSQLPLLVYYINICNTTNDENTTIPNAQTSLGSPDLVISNIFFKEHLYKK